MHKETDGAQSNWEERHGTVRRRIPAGGALVEPQNPPAAAAVISTSPAYPLDLRKAGRSFESWGVLQVLMGSLTGEVRARTQRGLAK